MNAKQPVPSDASGASARLLDAILTHSFQRGRFRLSSGAWSDFYLDLRRTSLHPEGLAAAAEVLFPAVREADVVAVGGPTLGADPLVAGLILESRRHGSPLRGFLVRAAAKEHGTGKQIEGHCPAGSRVAVLDDVCTRGGSILRAIEAVRAEDATPVLALALVDRSEGGREAIEAAGVPFHAPFRLEEVLAAVEARNL